MKSRLATILVTAVVTAVVTSVCWVIGIAVVTRIFVGTPPPFVVRVEAPTEIALNETFEVRVEVSNPTEDPLELGSIDVYDSLLGGFNLEAVEPSPKQQNHTLDFTTFYVHKTLAPGKSVITRFRLEAAKPGVWTGDIDCCTPAERFVTSTVTIAVKEAKGAGAARDPQGDPDSDPAGGKRPRPTEL